MGCGYCIVTISDGSGAPIKLPVGKPASAVLNTLRHGYGPGFLRDEDDVIVVEDDCPLLAGAYEYVQTKATDLSGFSDTLKRMEDVIRISLVGVKRELMFTTSKQSVRPGNGKFKNKLIEFYGVDTTDPVDQNKDWTRNIRCMMTQQLFTQKDVTAAHLIGYSMRHYAPVLLGIKDLDSPRNGMLFLKPLEDAFDDSRICFSYDKLKDSFILHILDEDYLDKKVGDSKRLSKESKTTVGNTSFRDLEGRVILFPNSNRPFKRALQFHARQAIALSIERGTLRKTFRIESWDFDYGSAGDYRDVVERWFITQTEDVRQDYDLSEDRTISTEADSRSWSEEPHT